MGQSMQYFAPGNITLGDINIQYVDEGQGPSILLCHGFPETWYSWRHQIKSLSQAGYRVIAPDMRGYGGSSSPEDPKRFNIIEIVDDLIGLIDALELKQTTIVGHDWGAVVAWHAALLRPDKFNGVAALEVPMMPLAPLSPTKLFPQTATHLFYVLYFQTPGVAERDFEQDVPLTLAKIYSWLSAAEAPTAQSTAQSTAQYIQSLMVSRDQSMVANLPAAHALPWLSSDDFNKCVQDFQKSGFRGGLNYYRNMDRNWELMKAVSNKQILVPAMIMIAESTLQMPGMKEIVENMHSLVPDLRAISVISECGHWIQQEKPEQTTEALLTFFESLQNK